MKKDSRRNLWWWVGAAAFAGAIAIGQIRDVETANLGFTSIGGDDAESLPSGYSWPPPLQGPPLRESDPVGETRGSIDVTFRGSLAYSIPIDVPQGRNGIQPTLAINYDSQGPNGWLGVGFQLSGLSRVHRCDRIYARDGEARGGEELCLDGERLVWESGSRYRTERESLARIEEQYAIGFKVEHANGTVWHYGFPPGCANVRSAPRPGESPISSVSDSSECNAVMFDSEYRPSEWWVYKIEDRFGNFMRIGYAPLTNPYREEAGYQRERVEQRVNFIQYTGHSSGDQPRREVSFTWEGRPDQQYGFAGGRRNSRTQRLKRIDVRSAFVDVRSYRFNYDELGAGGASRLVQVQECDGAGVCMQPTRFAWTDSTAQMQARTVGDAPADVDLCSDGHPVMNPAHPYVMDFNGDGAADLVYPERGVWTVRLSERGNMLSEVVRTSISADVMSDAQPLDYNQDGLVDLVMLDDTETTWIVLISDGNDFQRHDTGVAYGGSAGDIVLGNENVLCSKPPEQRFLQSQISKKTMFLDFDGNGLTDLLTCLQTNSNRFEWILRRNLGNGWDSNGVSVDQRARFRGRATGCVDSRDFAMDIDGDGSQELVTTDPGTNGPTQIYRAVHYTEGAFGPVSNPNAEVKITSLGIGPRYSHHILDTNGDGLLDLVMMSEDGATGDHDLFVNRGGRFAAAPNAAFRGLWHTHSIPFDYERDGRHDLLQPFITADRADWLPDRQIGHFAILRPTAGSYYSASSRGADSLEVVSLPDLPYIPSRSQGLTLNQPGVTRARVGDFDGNGTDDIVAWIQGRWTVLVMERTPDAITQIWEGFRAGDPATYTATHAPLSDAFYTRARGCTYPLRCLTGAMHVVKSLEIDAGFDTVQLQNNGRPTRRIDYRYRDARMDMAGHGFLGFATIQHSEDNFQTQTVTTHYRSHSVEYLDRKLTGNGGWGRLAFSFHYPYRGLVRLQETEIVDERGDRDPSNDVTYVGHVASEYEHLTFNWSRNEPLSYGAFLRATTETLEQRRGGGTGVQLRSSSTRVDSRDAFGNALLTVSDDGVQVRETETTYRNDTQAWLIGLPLTEQITLKEKATGSQVAQHYQYSYDATTGALTETLRAPGSPLALASRQRYDRYGNVIRTEEEAGSLRRGGALQYDSLESIYPVAAMNDLGHVTQWAYHPGLDAVTAEADANGLTTQFHLDGFGRVKEEARPDGSTTRMWVTAEAGPDFRYAASWLDSAGGSERIVFDRWNRPVRHIRAGSGGVLWQREWSYSRKGEVETQSWPRRTTEPLSARTTFVHDSMGRPVRTDYPDGTSASIAYDGFRVTHTDEMGRSSVLALDLAGRPVETTDALGGRTRVSYGPLGDIRRIDDPAGNSVVFIRDAYGRLLRNEDPNHGTREYTYDGFDRLVRVLDGNQETINFAYDTLDRAVRRTDPEGTSEWIYDTRGRGRLTSSRSSDGVQQHYYYDALGRENRIDTIVDRTAYTETLTYDAAGRLATIAYPQPVRSAGTPANTPFTVRHNYDLVGNLVSVANEQSGHLYWEALERNAMDDIAHERFGNGVVSIHDYDPLNNLLTLIDTVDAQGAPIQALRYEHNAAGIVTTRRDDLQGVDEQFQYDPLYRLTEANVCQDHQCTTRMTVQYDAIGNITNRSDLGQYTYDRARPNAVTEIRGALGQGARLAFSYDGNGNQTGRPGYSIEYTTHNLPRGYYPTTAINPDEDISLFGNSNTVTSSSVRVDFKYDADATRVYKRSGQTTTHYVSGILEREIDAGEERRRHFVFAEGRVVAEVAESLTLQGQPLASQTRYFHLDGLGSTDATSDAQGRVLERVSFDPFGAARDPNWHSTSAPAFDLDLSYGFTGHEADSELGLINMQGRIYDPRIGRFLSPDPIMADAFDGQSHNRYSYVRNNPLSLVDPTGYDYSGSIPGTENKGSSPASEHAGWADSTRNTTLSPSQAAAVRAYILGGVAPDASPASSPPCAQATSGQSLYVPPGAMGAQSGSRAPGRPSWTVWGVAKSVASGAWGLVDPTADIRAAYTSAKEYYAEPGFWTGISLTVSLAAALPGLGKAVGAARKGWRFVSAGRGTMNTTRRASSRARASQRGGGCFVAGTPVLAEDGYVPIETLRVGDRVWAQTHLDEDVALHEITRTFVRQQIPTLEVEVELAESSEVIVTTAEHPFYTSDGWLPAVQLETDMFVYSADGNWWRIRRVRHTGEFATVYNFEVPGAHSYFVGTSSIWVHNYPVAAPTKVHTLGIVSTPDGSSQAVTVDRPAETHRNVERTGTNNSANSDRRGSGGNGQNPHGQNSFGNGSSQNPGAQNSGKPNRPGVQRSLPAVPPTSRSG